MTIDWFNVCGAFCAGWFVRSVADKYLKEAKRQSSR